MFFTFIPSGTNGRLPIGETFRTLKKGFGYGLSVAIVVYPEKGKAIFEKLRKKLDKDINWILD